MPCSGPFRHFFGTCSRLVPYVFGTVSVLCRYSCITVSVLVSEPVRVFLDFYITRSVLVRDLSRTMSGLVRYFPYTLSVLVRDFFQNCFRTFSEQFRDLRFPICSFAFLFSVVKAETRLVAVSTALGMGFKPMVPSLRQCYAALVAAREVAS